MKKEIQPFWKSRKFWYVLIAAIVFVSLALTKTVVFTSDQVMVFVLALAGLGIGGHTVTDIASTIAKSKLETAFYTVMQTNKNERENTQPETPKALLKE